MEANRGDAAKAAAVGKRFLVAGNTAKALKFLEKSNRLFPNSAVQTLIKRIQSGEEKGGSSENSSKGGNGAAPGVRQRPKATIPTAPVRPFTKEQSEAVRRVKNCKDFYEILGVQRNAPDPVIKKAYRKLALRLHPDKNPAPGADEAFKEVSRAWTVLSDGDKRAHYDQFGSEDAPAQRYRQQHRDEQFDPEEIFNMFFGQGFAGGQGMGGGHARMFRFGQGANRQQQRQRGGDGNGGGEQTGNFLQLLPILMLFLLSFFSFPQNETQTFSLHQTGSFGIARRTRTRGVVPDIPFFVETGFQSKYGRDRRTLTKVERLVETEYARVVQRSCTVEKKNKERRMYDARRSRNAQQLKQATSAKMPNCDEFQRLQSLMGN